MTVNRQRSQAIWPKIVLLAVPPSWRRSTSIALICSLALSGCLILPVPVKKEALPYSEDSLAFIVPGATTRKEIYRAIGLPNLVRADGSLVVYGQARTVAGVIWMVGAMYSADGGMFPIESLHYLVIRFDGDMVTSAEVLREDATCTSDGICIDAVFDHDAHDSGAYDYVSVFGDAVLFASGEDERRDREASNQADRCHVYLYQQSGTQVVRVYRPRRGTRAINAHGYLSWSDSPGKYRIIAATRYMPDDCGNAGDQPSCGFHDVSYELECIAGQQLFLAIHEDRKWWKYLEPQPALSIRAETREVGMSAIQERRLILE